MNNRRVEPHLFVVFGGTGDLMRRKLLPALYRLSEEGLLEGRQRVLGAARSDVADAEFRSQARTALGEAGLDADDGGHWCEQCLCYQSIGGGNDSDYEKLAARIEALERHHDLPGNRVFYLALPPAGVQPTIERLGRAGLNRSDGWTRLVVEKPFGHDLESAVELNRLVHRHFDESQIYRIDHYLGKETVQNLLVFRFANAMFESLWNRDRIDRVEIVVAETVGVEGRTNYYEQTGVIRDMVQNHLTQLLTLTAMEVPAAFDAEAIRDEKVKVLRSIAPLDPGDVVLGQYGPGEVDGQRVVGYGEEAEVAADVQTPTYFAARLELANWRWQGVPFYLETGKRLPRRETRICVTFRCPPVSLFRHAESGPCTIHANTLVITLQPDEGFALGFEVKKPGQRIELQTNHMRFRYRDVFGPLSDAYETLLLDIMTGDQTLFVRGDEVEDAWRLYEPILRSPPPVREYAAGTWGPDHGAAPAGHRDQNHEATP